MIQGKLHQEAFTKAADKSRETMERYAGHQDAPAPRPMRESDQREHQPEQPGPHAGRRGGR
ncbi:hypothetical protein OG204_00015 [Streptomyces sp. NBC_01387]|uniref:hypothetical protein n=1 Tax=Streptomyces sp. NBC_01387 TaxID=2903849 RepID=UPI00324AB4F3